MTRLDREREARRILTDMESQTRARARELDQVLGDLLRDRVRRSSDGAPVLLEVDPRALIEAHDRQRLALAAEHGAREALRAIEREPDLWRPGSPS